MPPTARRKQGIAICRRVAPLEATACLLLCMRIIGSCAASQCVKYRKERRQATYEYHK